MTFAVYIPARFGATRLPGKPLLELEGRPLIAHVCERALASGAQSVVVATDDERIARAAAAAGARFAMTDADLPSGTDRIAAAAAANGEPAERVIVNVQGDEPRMPADVIRQVAALAAGPCDMATVCEPLDAEQLIDPNVVKVVRGEHDRAIYFSRAPVPWDRNAFADGGRTPASLDAYRRHVGIYGYRVAFLERFVAAAPSLLERIEALEQLRALGFGADVRVPDAERPCGTGVDTTADLARLRGA